MVLSLKAALEAIVTSNTLNSESIVRWSKCNHSELQTILKVVNRPSRTTYSNMHHQVDVAVKDNSTCQFAQKEVEIVCIICYLWPFVEQSSTCAT